MRSEFRAIELNAPAQARAQLTPSAALAAPAVDDTGPLTPRTSRDESFTAVVTAVRWATTAVALLLLSTGTRTRADAITGAGVLAYALWRTVRPIEISRGGAYAITATLVEMAVMLTAVILTGYWTSVFVLGLVTVVCVAGFAGGYAFSLPAAATSILAVAVPYHLTDATATVRFTSQWAGELMLVAIVTGFARGLTVTASAETSAFMDRLRQLSEANRLLLQLHHVTTTLPMSLDLNDTLESNAARLRDLFEPDVLVILLRDDGIWTVAKSSGTQLAGELATADLPQILADALADATPTLVTPLGGSNGQGLTDESRAGLYAPLWARQELVGLVALERRGVDGFAAPQPALLEAFVEQMAVSIDNARWFARIGTLAAGEERTRIARDLHDRVGQSLALVSFELDRAARNTPEEDVRRQLLDLRETVRSVVAELRETLSDLRTDISEEHDLNTALSKFLDRVARRALLEVTFSQKASRRLPIPVEREIWRIAQEAVTNAERHSGARSLVLAWTTGEQEAELRVTDDGKGMPPSSARRQDSYGILGMQERADAIGGSLTIVSTPDQGTEVRLWLRR